MGSIEPPFDPANRLTISIQSPCVDITARVEAISLSGPVFGWFLSRVSILLLTRDIDIAILSVRPSVRDTLVLYENGLTYRHSFSTIR